MLQTAGQLRSWVKWLGMNAALLACVLFQLTFDTASDNIETTKSYCVRKFNMASDMINKHFGIPADLEYVE